MQLPESADPLFSSEEAFRSGAAEGLLLVSDAPDDRYQFFESLRMSVLASLGLSDAAEPPEPAIFVLAQRPRQAAEHFGPALPVIDIDLRDAQQWAGRLVFAAQHGTGGWSVEMPGGDLSHAIKALIDSDHGEAPFAIVYAKTRTISCAVEGAAAGDRTLKLALPAASRKLTLQDIQEVLEVIRTEGLMTPAVCLPQIWGNAAKYIPGTETERILQWCVASEMRAHFRPIFAEREQVTTIGRIDICLTDPNTIEPNDRHPAVVELKVLRSRSSSGNSISDRINVAAVAGGMRQAKAYRVTKKAIVGVLACFDLRQTKSNLLEHATVQKSKLRYFDEHMAVSILPMYGLPEDAQDEIAAA